MRNITRCFISAVLPLVLGAVYGCSSTPSATASKTQSLNGCDFAAPCTFPSFCYSDPLSLSDAGAKDSGIMVCDPTTHTLTSTCLAGYYCNATDTPGLVPGCIDASGTALICDMSLDALGNPKDILVVAPVSDAGDAGGAAGNGGSGGSGGSGGDTGGSGGVGGSLGGSGGIGGSGGSGGDLGGSGGTYDDGGAGTAGTGGSLGGSGGIGGSGGVGGSLGGSGGIGGSGGVGGSLGGSAGTSGGAGSAGTAGSGGSTCPSVTYDIACVEGNYGCLPHDVAFCMTATPDGGYPTMLQCLCPNAADGMRGTWMQPSSTPACGGTCWATDAGSGGSSGADAGVDGSAGSAGTAGAAGAGGSSAGAGGSSGGSAGTAGTAGSAGSAGTAGAAGAGGTSYVWTCSFGITPGSDVTFDVKYVYNTAGLGYCWAFDQSTDVPCGGNGASQGPVTITSNGTNVPYTLVWNGSGPTPHVYFNAEISPVPAAGDAAFSDLVVTWTSPASHVPTGAVAIEGWYIDPQNVNHPWGTLCTMTAQ